MPESRIARRGFLLLGSAALLVGCPDPRARQVASARPYPVPRSPRGHLDTAYPTSYGAPPPSTCALTEANIEGPYFKPGAPQRTTLADGAGVALFVGGLVRGADCGPIAGARLEVWQADHQGRYDSAGFAFRAQMVTDARGEYRFDTIVPGHYLNGRTYRPAHVHVKVHAPGRPILTTQLYFEGDPYNEGDPFIRDSLVMRLESQYGGGKGARFDFVV
jgi:protocatechuate 3,4-dioxygenase beta subunit